MHLSRLTFSITPDEALVETRQKLVIEKIIGSISEKMKTFGHIYKDPTSTHISQKDWILYTVYYCRIWIL